MNLVDIYVHTNIIKTLRLVWPNATEAELESVIEMCERNSQFVKDPYYEPMTLPWMTGPVIKDNVVTYPLGYNYDPNRNTVWLSGNTGRPKETITY